VIRPHFIRFISLAAGFSLLAIAVSAQDTALDRYVAQRDSVYAWKLAGTIPGEGYRTYVLELTSQRWRSEKDVDHPVWKHWLSITKPDQLSTNKVLLYIGGGSINDPPPSKASVRAARIATEAGSIVAELGGVPNEPLRFTDSPPGTTPGWSVWPW
jgi:PhoPQ-activated pathogenicity-related protein